tara:strand:+ start:702 stop:3539 length:2838 start_codon:yes stop_codon:yes gene_type:complete
MTSLSETIGRIWFDNGPPIDGEDHRCDTYLGLRIPVECLRPNAVTLWDVKPDANGNTYRTLVRMFARLSHQILGNDKLCEGARAVMEWEGSDQARPDHLRIHLLLNPPDHGAGVSTGLKDIVDELIAADNKAFRCQKKSPATKGARTWAESDMVLAHDQWAALCGVYAPIVDELPGSRGMSMCPLEIFGAKNCGVGDRYDEEEGTFRLLPSYVPMRRCDFESRILFRKYLVWYQTAQLGIPVRLEKPDPVQGRIMLRLATAVPVVAVDDKRSVWEKVQARAARARADGMDPELYRKWATSEVEHSMDGEQGGYVPECERVVNEHEMKPLPAMPYADGSLSPFATWTSWFMMQSECWAWVYKQHLLLLQLFIGSMDCYRECQSGEVHFSCILAGPPSSSKSFAFTLLERLLIRGTIETATRRTENALTYSQDQGSRIMIDHELSKDFFGDVNARKSSGTSRTSQTKEILTSHKATVESCCVDDNGQRIKVRSESRAQLCYFAATNDWSTGGGCDTALISRFYVVFPTLGRVTNKPLSDLMQHDRNPSKIDKEGFMAMQEWARTVQKCCYWIMRLIHLGAIPDVDLSAVNAVIDLFNRGWGTMASPRAYERVTLLARVCAIITAIQMHYSLPGAPRAGEVPRVSHMSEIVPNLVSTAEQAKFCIGLVHSEFTNPSETPVLRALSKCNLVPDEAAGVNYLSISNVESTKVWIEEVMMHCDGDVTADAIQQCVNDLRERKITSVPYMRSPMTRFSVAPCTGEDPKNYYAMRGNSIHASLVDDFADIAAETTLEDVLHKKCRAGPEGREITASVVPGFPQLLQVRANDKPPTPYVKECLYLPSVLKDIIGVGPEVLEQDHRHYPKRVIDRPVELLAFSRRGGAPPTRPGGGIEYPRAYVEEVKAKRTMFGPAKLSTLDSEQYNTLKRSLPDECFEQHKKINYMGPPCSNA